MPRLRRDVGFHGSRRSFRKNPGGPARSGPLRYEPQMRTVWGRKAGERPGAELRLKFALTACHRESGRPRRGFWGLPLTQLFPACLPSTSGLHIARASPDAAGCRIQNAPCPARVRRRLFSGLVAPALFCCVMEPPRESVLVRAICGALPLLSLGLGGIVFGCTAVDRRAEWEPRPHHCPSILQPFGVRDAGRAGGGARALAAA